MRIYLIGFMGSGKTSIGKRLAKRLDYTFLDLDDYIEEKYKKTVPEIFGQEGEDVFRKYEQESVRDTFKYSNVIVAAGGGTPCFHNNMDEMNANGVCIYLQRNIDFFIDKLLHAKTERPLIKGKSPEELRSYVEQTLKIRDPFYSKARYIVSPKSTDKDETAKKIKKLIEKHKKIESYISQI